MREIKFRCWDKKWSSFHNPRSLSMYPDGTFDSLPITSHEEYANPEDFIIQQYTGFKDHNGVEIYEGDYVLCHAGVPVEEWWKYEVKWKHGRLAAHCGDYVEPFHLRLYTVVGNIFEGVKNYEYRLEEPYHLTKITVKELNNEN